MTREGGIKTELSSFFFFFLFFSLHRMTSTILIHHSGLKPIAMLLQGREIIQLNEVGGKIILEKQNSREQANHVKLSFELCGV